MPTSRVYAFAEPENDGERRVIRYLDENLPAEYRIYHTMERSGGGQSYEYDILVLAPHALFCLEVKDWPGRLVGNDRDWLLNNGAVRRNPCPLIAKKSRILKNRLVAANAFLNAVWTEPLVVIADERTELHLTGDCAAKTVTLKGLIARVTDASNPQWAGRDLRTHFNAIEGVLTNDFQPAQGGREVAHFRLVEELGGTDLYTEWRAENRFAEKVAPVRLKIYAPDPYLPEAERKGQLLLVRRDFETAARLGSHPNILAARDFFPDEGNRYVLVLDDVAGSPLSAELLAGRNLTFENKLRVVEDIAAGLAHAHECKVVHRDVQPGNIWMTPGGAVLTNFDCARIGNGSTNRTIHNLVADGVDLTYMAPEVRANLAAATAASDVYALGLVLYELLAGQLPADPAAAPAPSTVDPLVERDLDELVFGMLSSEPAARPSAAAVRDALAGMREERRAPTQAPRAAVADAEEGRVDYTVGEVIEGQYLIREILGEGSFGKVYRVYSAVTDREYAMKIFRDAGLGLEDAQREFSMLSGLQHPRIARVWHAARLRQGVYYLLTDYIGGRPLQHLMDSNRPSPADALRILRDLLGALSYMHHSGYVHRDIKPSNILVSPGGAWLIDFNIAARATSTPADRAGTPLYTPPDITACAGMPTRDLFAAGVVLYELLTGRHPYNGPPQPGAKPKDPLLHEPRLTQPAAKMLLRSVATTAAERYQSVEEFLADLNAIEELIQPLAPDYPLVGGIAVSEEEHRRPNHNPYLSRFLTLYSQNRSDNSGTRGYDEISRATYVRTRLDKRLAPDILAGRYRLVIITGNAGDGKTACLQSLEEHVAQNKGVKPESLRLPSGNGAAFTLEGRSYQTNYDGSQDEGDRQNDDVLTDFFAPFAGAAEAVAKRSQGDVRLIAINEGKLRDFLARQRDSFPWLANAIEAHLEAGAALPDGYALVNLNDRSVVVGDESILDQQIRVLCNPVFWAACPSCQQASRCPVKFNVDSVNHPDLGPRIRRRLQRLFEIAHLRGRMHLTMRAVRSALAYILFGEDDCAGIAACLQAHPALPDSDEQILRRFYYNAIAAHGSVDRDEDAPEETDRLLRLLAEADVGLCANPAVDRDLFFNGPEKSPLLPAAGGRSAYDRDLFASIQERLATAQAGEATQASYQRVHAAMRRKAFFERPDDGWETMLPYSQLTSMLQACAGDAAEMETLKSGVLQGINHGEGISDGEGVLVLRLARGVPGRVRSYREFPAAEFTLRPASPQAESDYIEHSPAYLEMIHRPGTNGNAVGRPVLRIGLDLLELLGRMGRGYAPTSAEWRGPLVNLLVFRTQLAHECYNRLLLVDVAQQRRYQVVQTGGQVTLIP